MTPTEIFEVGWKLAAIVFACGAVWSELKAVRKDISRLEEKQDKYNHLQERMARVEDSCSNAHHRITELHYGVHNPYETKNQK